ncbi:hypothetical protein FRC03_003460 [Tulasnella sp. 419]|nr:hypothetical protein FRC03_003460 [Tulasnella sp. 419]
MMAENCKDDWRYTALNALSVKEWDSRNGRKAHKSSYIILIDIRASDLPARGNIVMQQLVSAFYQDKTDLTGPGADLVHSTILTPFYSTVIPKPQPTRYPC